MYMARRFKDAVVQIRQTLTMEDRAPTILTSLALCYLQLGQVSDAYRALQRAFTAIGQHRAAARAGAYAETPERDLGLALLEALEAEPIRVAWLNAQVAVQLGERDRALQWLELGYREREGEMVLVGADPGFGPLRADPRFQDLQRRIGGLG